MMATVTSTLTATTSVYPENSHVIRSDVHISGRVDFVVINSTLRWGIELLIKGHKLMEHRERFIGDGKCVELLCNQYIIVDFREIAHGAKVKKLKKKNVITVYFCKGDYSTARCLLPNGSVKTITLTS